MSKLFSLKKLFSNAFVGHKGRPGQVGGSLPRSGSAPISAGDFDKKVFEDSFSKAVSSSYNSKHVPSAISAYGELEDFIDDASIELDENSDLSLENKSFIKRRIRAAEREQKLLIQRFGPMIADDYR